MHGPDGSVYFSSAVRQVCMHESLCHVSVAVVGDLPLTRYTSFICLSVCLCVCPMPVPCTDQADTPL